MISQHKKLIICIVASLLSVASFAGWHCYQENTIPSIASTKTLDSIQILMYHKVNPNPLSGGLGLRVTPKSFNWQIDYLKKNGFHSVNLGDVVDHFQKGKELPDKPIVITFDDGYKDNYLYAYPILKKYNFTATIFVVAGTIGQTNSFDVKAKLGSENKMLNWDEIKELDAAGITIASHTVDHLHLAHVPLSEAKKEIENSKKILEAGLGKEVQYFCYPYGDCNQAVAKLVQAAGYKAATTTRLGLARDDSNPFLLSRVRVTGHYSNRTFVENLYKF